ncbi:MAG TPA: hypothetical protein VH063_02090 [Gaiellaceae bacterium]|jgi:hypothetical protein|nr:hypothetical protein [Gaiellaceae bacterium]
MGSDTDPHASRPRLPLAGWLALLVTFSAGVTASLALAHGDGGLGLITTKGGPKPGKQAVALGKEACAGMRSRVGKKRFTKTFKTTAECYAVMAQQAQSAVALCRKRYPPGSTADLYCLQLELQSSPVERAVVAGLRITTGKSVTYIPVPTAGPGAGTGSGTGAGTGGGIPGSHG